MYPQNSLQTINKNQMLNNFNNPNTQNIIYKNTNNIEDECINIFDKITASTNNYILVKEIDNEFFY